MAQIPIAKILDTNRAIQSLNHKTQDLIDISQEHGENIRELFANSNSGVSKAEMLAMMTTLRTEIHKMASRSNNDTIDKLMTRVLRMENDKIERDKESKENKSRIGKLEQEIKELRSIVYDLDSKMSEFNSFNSFKESIMNEQRRNSVQMTSIQSALSTAPTPSSPQRAAMNPVIQNYQKRRSQLVLDEEESDPEPEPIKKSHHHHKHHKIPRRTGSAPPRASTITSRFRSSALHCEACLCRGRKCARRTSPHLPCRRLPRLAV
jgi:hypothetical protein